MNAGMIVTKLAAISCPHRTLCWRTNVSRPTVMTYMSGSGIRIFGMVNSFHATANENTATAMMPGLPSATRRR